MANRKRNKRLVVDVSSAEYEIIKERIVEAGVKFQGDYVRKMVLQGYIVRFDTTEVKELIRLIANATSNINQITKRANESRSVYASDVQDLLLQVHELKQETTKAINIYKKARKLFNP